MQGHQADLQKHNVEEQSAELQPQRNGSCHGSSQVPQPCMHISNKTLVRNMEVAMAAPTLAQHHLSSITAHVLQGIQYHLYTYPHVTSYTLLFFVGHQALTCHASTNIRS